MSDEQIIMGLKCCYSNETPCEECPFDTFEDCNDVLMADYVIDLIKRQKAGIERLEELNKEMFVTISEQQAEIERLQQPVFIMERREMTDEEIKRFQNHNNSFID